MGKLSNALKHRGFYQKYISSKPNFSIAATAVYWHLFDSLKQTRASEQIEISPIELTLLILRRSEDWQSLIELRSLCAANWDESELGNYYAWRTSVFLVLDLDSIWLNHFRCSLFSNLLVDSIANGCKSLNIASGSLLAGWFSVVSSQQAIERKVLLRRSDSFFSIGFKFVCGSKFCDSRGGLCNIC